MNREDFIEEKVFYIEEEEVKDSEKKEKPQEDEKKTIQEPDNKKPQEDEEKKNEEKEKIHDEIKERKEELKSKLRDGLNQSSNKSEEDRNNKLKSLGGKFNFKGFVMLLFIVTLIASAPALLSTNAKTPSNEVGYSEFINHVKNKEIVKVNEKEGYVYGYSPEDEKKEVKKETQ